jgi:hypothetical protein
VQAGHFGKLPASLNGNQQEGVISAAGPATMDASVTNARVNGSVARLRHKQPSHSQHDLRDVQAGHFSKLPASLNGNQQEGVPGVEGFRTGVTFLRATSLINKESNRCRLQQTTRRENGARTAHSR